MFVCFFSITSPANIPPHFDLIFLKRATEDVDLNEGANMHPEKHASPFKNEIAVWSHGDKHAEIKESKPIWNRFQKSYLMA